MTDDETEDALVIANETVAGLAVKLAERNATIAALTRKIEELEKGWMPIETAPKDGTHILVSDPSRMAVATYGGDEGPEGWFVIGLHWAEAGSNLEPTHWMPTPLPPPPVPDQSAVTLPKEYVFIVTDNGAPDCVYREKSRAELTRSRFEKRYPERRIGVTRFVVSDCDACRIEDSSLTADPVADLEAIASSLRSAAEKGK